MTKKTMGGQSLRRNGLIRAYLEVDDDGDDDDDDPGTCLKRLNKTTINVRIIGILTEMRTGNLPE
jgi:hypothetical protein